MVTASPGKGTAEDLAALVDLAEAGSFRAVRDRTYDLADIAEAHRYVDTTHAIVASTVTQDLPRLREAITRLLGVVDED